MRTSHLASLAAFALAVGAPAAARAATYQVGPTRAITELDELSDTLQPGDVVELDGDATYAGDVWMEAWGTAEAPVTIRGVPVNGRRPVIAGGDYTFILYGGHYVVENVDVTGGAEVCLFHKAQDMVVRDSIVHDCAQHGILGADWDTGSLVLERVEVTRNGYDLYKHQIYVATDETTYPGSVFRMVGCWVHDANGGNSVKSRAERVELYGNWIEGAMFHELDLIGSQEHAPDVAREDTDVVGNVLIKSPTSEYTIARVGGDGTGDSAGRHRFANNTMILGELTDYAIRVGGQAESVELHNNVIVGTSAHTLWREEYEGTTSFSGVSNWISEGIVLPDDRVGGVRGIDPGFVDLAGGDLHPAEGSPLLDAATPSPASPPGLEFPAPQGVPAFLPPWPEVRGSLPRNQVGGLDVGAFELGSEDVDPGPGTGAGGAGGGGGGGTDDGEGGAGGGPDGAPAGEADPASEGCSVHEARAGAGAARGAGRFAVVLLAAAGLYARRRRAEADAKLASGAHATRKRGV
jgi:hypothetical protein